MLEVQQRKRGKNHLSNVIKHIGSHGKDLVRKYLLKYLCTYPLRSACSVVVEHPEGKFKEEYIVSLLLLQWVVNDTDFDGISYESCKDSYNVKSLWGAQCSACYERI